MEIIKNALGGKVVIFQPFIGLLPYMGSAGLVQKVINAEIALQLKMGPVIQRITQRVRDCFCPCGKLLIGVSIAGAVAFRHAITTHGAPFIVVSLQPDLKQVIEPAILCYLPGGEMAMVVKNRLAGGILPE